MEELSWTLVLQKLGDVVVLLMPGVTLCAYLPWTSIDRWVRSARDEHLHDLEEPQVGCKAQGRVERVIAPMHVGIGTKFQEQSHTL